MHREIATTEGHAGKYVAFRSKDDDFVIAAGNDPKTVFELAKKKGVYKTHHSFYPRKKQYTYLLKDYLINLETLLPGVKNFLFRFIVTLDYPQKIITLDF
jgi:hypothetical protein